MKGNIVTHIRRHTDTNSHSPRTLNYPIYFHIFFTFFCNSILCLVVKRIGFDLIAPHLPASIIPFNLYIWNDRTVSLAYIILLIYSPIIYIEISPEYVRKASANDLIWKLAIFARLKKHVRIQQQQQQNATNEWLWI